MAMKPVAKKATLVLAVVYVVTVIMLIASARLAGLSEQEQKLAGEFRETVNALIRSQNEKATQEAAEGDPQLGEEVQVVSEISEDQATEIWKEYIAPRGPIIAFNYTLVLQILNFGVLVLFLYGFLWDPVLKFLDERSQAVAENIQSAEADREEARQEREEADQEKRKALEERNASRSAATREAQEIRDDIVRNAREESARMVESTRQELEVAVEQAKASLRAEVAELACAAASQVIQRDLKPEDHRSLVEQFMEDLEKAKAEV